jgi:hypothetical protein
MSLPVRALILGIAAVHALAVGRLDGQQTRCPPLDSTAAWARVNRSWSNEIGQTWSNDSLRQVLLAMAARDQEARRDFGAQATDTAYGRRLMALDSTLADQMTEILAVYGLPTRALVGAAGADAAMLVVQHNWPLQERVLDAARAVPAGQISPQALAMLEDRVLVHQGKRQRYGTQFDLGPDGLFHFAPTEDLPGLERRRTRAGLPPLPQYVCMMEEAGIRVDRGSLPLRRPQ